MDLQPLQRTLSRSISSALPLSFCLLQNFPPPSPWKPTTPGALVELCSPVHRDASPPRRALRAGPGQGHHHLLTYGRTTFYLGRHSTYTSGAKSEESSLLYELVKIGGCDGWHCIKLLKGTQFHWLAPSPSPAPCM